ncbi:MAG: acetoacetate--CoA ligase [Acidimicrobiales bacterium]|nr:acetoacetate--CoA ligase [Acidimicrobiales bacterium]
MSELLWTPTPGRVERSHMDRFRRAVKPELADSDELWKWSVDNPGEFWRAVWNYCGVIGDPGERDLESANEFWKWRFLPDAKLNMAENLLAGRAGAGPNAIVAIAEDGSTDIWSWGRLRSETAAAANWLRSVGVEKGDCVAAWMPHLPETVVLFLAVASIGAVYTTTSADFGVDGVVDRFGQTAPKVLLAADGYTYGGKPFGLGQRAADIATALPSVEHVLVVEGPSGSGTAVGETNAAVHRWDDAVGALRGAELTFEQLPTDHPMYILYSSGTTGKPKCIVHRTGGVLLKHLSEQQLHCDVHAGDKVFYFTTCGWMMWNWLVSGLATGATIVLYDGNPVYPSQTRLFEEAENHSFSLMGVSAKFIDGSLKAGLTPGQSFDLASVRTICSTGSPLSNDGFGWVYDAVAQDVHLASVSGGTDLCGCLVGCDPTKPVVVGELQGKCVGMNINIFDPDGRPITDLHTKGELVCTTPFPSMPLHFWDDPGDVRYRAAYFDRFPDTWAHGDFASWEAGGGIVIHGRSDATLNASGVRIGTAEIYNVVEQLPEVAEAIAIGQQWDNDTRVVLFVRLAEGAVLDDLLERKIRTELRTKRTPRHVPAIIRAVPDIPRTRSGKITELAVTDVVHGRPINNTEALANPESLKHFTLD